MSKGNHQETAKALDLGGLEAYKNEMGNSLPRVVHLDWTICSVKEFKVQEEVSNIFSAVPSLKHLSRLSARQMFLKESFNFKKVPSFKELPKTLQDYILFSDLDKKQLTLSYADIKANYNNY